MRPRCVPAGREKEIKTQLTYNEFSDIVQNMGICADKMYNKRDFHVKHVVTFNRGSINSEALWKINP